MPGKPDYPAGWRRRLMPVTAALLGLFLLWQSAERAAFAQGTNHRKHALLIAVTNYKKLGKGNAGNLNTLPDVQAIQAALMRAPWNFAASEIKILTLPEETTHEAIVKAFRTYLIEPTRAGDSVYFHYSGHGSTIADPGDATGVDQTLVPSDYVLDGSNDIRDKEIAKLLEELKRKNPSSVLLSFDCCHSGTITRNGGGRMLIREFPRDLPAAVAQKRSTEPVEQKAGGLLGPGEIGKLGYTVLSACRSDQVDSEVADDSGKPMGSLAYALVKALNQPVPQMTYRDLMAQVKSTLRAKGLDQVPQIEGIPDQEVMGTKVIRPNPSFPVTLEANKTLRMQGGSLMGITQGSAVALFAAGTKQFKGATPIAKAKIVGVGPTFAALGEIMLEPGRKLEELGGASALITEQSYPNHPLQIDLSGLKGHPQEEAIRAALGSLDKRLLTTQLSAPDAWDIRILPAAKAFEGETKATQVANAPDLWEVRSAGASGAKRALTENLMVRGANPTEKDTLVLQRKSGSLLTVKVGEDKEHDGIYYQALSGKAGTVSQITEGLKRECRRRLLSGLMEGPRGDSPIKIEIRVIPIEVKPDPLDPAGKAVQWKQDKAPEATPTAGGQIVMHTHAYFRVQIRNIGTLPTYVTILDLQSDGGIGPLWPGLAEKTDNLVPVGNEWIDIKTGDGVYAPFEVTDPTGEESLQAIATEYEADFSPLLDETSLRGRGVPRGAGVRGATEATTPLGLLLLDAVTSTRSRDRGISRGGWSVSTLNITVAR